jgi:hypothetical protein
VLVWVRLVLGLGRLVRGTEIGARSASEWVASKPGAQARPLRRILPHKTAHFSRCFYSLWGSICCYHKLYCASRRSYPMLADIRTVGNALRGVPPLERHRGRSLQSVQLVSPIERHYSSMPSMWCGSHMAPNDTVWHWFVAIWHRFVTIWHSQCHSRPLAFGRETACVARFGTIWHTLRFLPSAAVRRACFQRALR